MKIEQWEWKISSFCYNEWKIPLRSFPLIADFLFFKTSEGLRELKCIVDAASDGEWVGNSSRSACCEDKKKNAPVNKTIKKETLVLIKLQFLLSAENAFGFIARSGKRKEKEENREEMSRAIDLRFN